MRKLLLVVAFVAGASAASAQGAPGVPGERFGNWVFNTPPGWARSEGTNGLTLTAPDGQATLLLRPGEELSIGLKLWLDAQVALLERGLRVENAEAPQTATTDDHYEVIVWSRALSDAQGRLLARAYMAFDPRARAELIVFSTVAGEAFQRYRPVVETFVDSARFANVLGIPKPRPQPLPPVPTASPNDPSHLGVTRDTAASEPVPDEFSCYASQVSDDYSSPDFLLQILPGRQYRTASGTGAFDVIRTPSGGDVRWQSGPLAATIGVVGWQTEGQVLVLGDVTVEPGGVRRRVACYQRGAREALARAAFERLDPRPGSYRCLSKYGQAPAGTLEILPGRRYRYGGSEGAYSVNIMGSLFSTSRLSTLKFFGGPFGGGSGTYGDLPPGRQWYSVTARVSIECER